MTSATAVTGLPKRRDGIVVRIKDTQVQDKVVTYKVETLIRATFRRAEVWHRFSEFQEAYDSLKSDFAKYNKQHLDDLPDFILKRPKLLQNHVGKKFIEERRLLLQDWTKRTLETPRVDGNKGFMDFLGLAEHMGEIERVRDTKAVAAADPGTLHHEAVAAIDTIGNEDL